MNSEVNFFLETINTQCTILRDQCHRALKVDPAYMIPLNRIWSTLDLLTMAVKQAESDIRMADRDRSSGPDGYKSP